MVYLMLADGFEEVEALTPIDILRRGGVDVKTVSVKDKTVTGGHGVKITADLSLYDIDETKMDMIILPGGNGGTENLDRTKEIHTLLNYAESNDKYIAAICAAPRILGYDGLLCGKTATIYPGMDKYLIGARKSDNAVVCDGKIITSKGLGTALEFSLTLLTILKDEKTAKKIASSVVA